MKRTLQNEYKYDKYDKIDMLWKKISKVPKPPIQRTDTLPTERFETSLELELLNEQKILKNSNKELKQKNAWKIRYQKQIQRREDQEDEKKKSFQDSLIKLSVSTYNIEATQQSNKYLKDQTCKPCLQRFQQIIRKLKQQIKLFLLDYKIFQQHIKLEIKSYWHEVQQLSNKMHSGSTTTQTKLDEQVLKMKLEQKKSVQDKLYYIEKENIVRKNSIIKLEQELLKAKEQSQLLQRSYFNLKISNLIQIHKSFYKQSSDNEFESKNLSAQKSEKLRFSQKGRNEDRVGQNKKQEENEQIQSIKKKLNGLKIRLNKTYSNIN